MDSVMSDGVGDGQPQSSQQSQAQEPDFEVTPDPISSQFPLSFYGDGLKSGPKDTQEMEVDGNTHSFAGYTFSDYSLSEPPSKKHQREPVSRTAASLVAANERFMLNEKSFTQQYSGVYFARLAALRPRVIVEAEKRWGEGFKVGESVHPTPRHVPRILDIPRGSLCWVVGTVYVEMALKPNILDEVTAEHWIVAPPPLEKYSSESDKYTLEDEHGRIKLTGSLLKDVMLVTGVVVAVLGAETKSGDFEVWDVAYASCAPQEPHQTFLVPNAPNVPDPSERKFVALISGLNMGSDSASHLQTELMAEWLAGWCGSVNDQKAVGKIACVIVAGGMIARESPKEGGKDSVGKFKRTTTSPLAQSSPHPIQLLDTLLSPLASSSPLVLIPGPHDPTTHSLPQQPLLRGLLPNLSGWTGTSMATNPFECVVEDVRFLGHAGQPLHDLVFHTPTSSLLTLATHTLRWQHLAPTAPDTLWCYPFKGGDPFVIGGRRKGKTRAAEGATDDTDRGEGGVWCPHVLFSGGGKGTNVETTIYQDASSGARVRVVIVPEFSKTGVIALVDLATGDVSSIHFGLGGF
ncbi:hypothetical protein M427DRAFT_52608 [Gonapodya prolifera JEL478]|uniref:DNA-directed DNA polymerase n=1 Tax=Gonapodya prolifera (strain JEL478) TaxID=1344416 RepID=A0A139ASK6_GONPJ|nr:hypothetical protein M427DRAFT_52608 [Gonapodya prolifera JEL478]|eukprot:KXS19726.1 hypothetical protein M427DRAFT_52608 [Gonapodya prolifera JEL478]